MMLLYGLLLLLFSIQANAFQWQDLWLTPNQQAQILMNKGEFTKAQALFDNKIWQAAASYKAGDYKNAAKGFKDSSSDNGFYNHGNALAHLGQYEAAIKAYDKALALNSKHEDALFNRQLVMELLKQEKQGQQGKDQQGKDQQGKDQQGKDQQGKDQQGKDQQGKDQQSKDQQGKDQQGKDQQSKDQQDKGKPAKAKVQSEAKREKQQAHQQWLQLIPDDPGGLMRQKLLRDHLRRQGRWTQ